MAKVWTSKKVNEVIRQLQEGSDKDPDTSCFYMGDIELKNSDVTFEYTLDEQEELVKCANDVVYFANKYGFAMTDDGISNIRLRPYQENMLHTFQKNRYVIMMAARQIGKCLLFNTKIKIKENNKIKVIPMYELWYKVLKPSLSKFSLKQKLIFKLKYFLYKLYDKLDS